ncbi:MAG TPA: hypothetical protein VMB34_25690 [Acetobacteraceae bacterium]|nr:hypothetical protein [Acetobacteraceae bacterium]
MMSGTAGTGWLGVSLRWSATGVSFPKRSYGRREILLQTPAVPQCRRRELPVFVLPRSKTVEPGVSARSGDLEHRGCGLSQSLTKVVPIPRRAVHHATVVQLAAK